MRSLSDRPDQLAAWYLGGVLAGQRESPEEAIAHVRAVSAEDGQTVAQQIVLDTVLENLDIDRVQESVRSLFRPDRHVLSFILPADS